MEPHKYRLWDEPTSIVIYVQIELGFFIINLHSINNLTLNTMALHFLLWVACKKF
jgi:hypothetical protein